MKPGQPEATTSPAGNPPHAEPAPGPQLSTNNPQPPHIPDHELLRRIGAGSYGEVWLARSALGTLRAVKIVNRASFDHDQPFEREFKGIQKFEPVSRSHEGLVDILQVGRNDAAGCFYYVMELADSSEPVISNQCSVNSQVVSAPGQSLSGTPLPADSLSTDPLITDYSPKTLRSHLRARTRLPVSECLDIGLALADALAHLHKSGLVHRDIKPSNIIFVGGTPKLADIGLVADISEARSFVGTTGFIPPEGPGTAQADLYSLGKVLYEISTGHDRQDFPALPPNLRELPDADALIEFNEIVVKACAADPRERYQTAEELHADMALLQRGASIKRKRTIQRHWAAMLKLGLVAGLIALLAVGGFLLRHVVTKNQAGSTGATTQPEMKGTKNREAWNAYLNGLHYYKRGTQDASKRAIEFLKEATRLDPNFAQPYASLAELYRWRDYLFSSGQEAMAKGKEAALQALALDDSLAQAHIELGYVAAHLDRDFSKAEKEVKRAIQLSPDYADGHAVYACLLREMRRLEEAKKEIKLTQRFDPVSPSDCCGASLVFLAAGQVDEAVAQLRKALDLDPNFPRAFKQLGELHEANGEYPEAIEMSRKAAVAEGIKPEKAAQVSEDLLRAFSTGGARGYWQKKLELADVQSNFGGDLYHIAVIYMHLGEKDSAFEFLDKVEAQKSDWAFRINFDRRFDSVRSDPRFLALLRKLGLEKWGGTTHRAGAETR